MRKNLRLLILGLATACLWLPFELDSLAAQEPQPPARPQSDSQTKIPVIVNLVILKVTVKDRKGVLVPDLQKDEFRIFDDHVEESLAFFSTESFPLSLVVLIDDDLKSSDAKQLVRSLHALAAGISAEDEAQICGFDLKFYPGQGFTKDSNQLVAELNAAQRASGPSTSGPVPFVTPPSTHPRGVGEPLGQAAPTDLGSRPTKALDDAIFSAAELLRDRGLDRRKIVLVVSDGLNGAAFNHHTYKDTITALLHNDISVYSLAVGNNSYQRKFSRLRSYANDSGGDTYYAAKSGDLEKLYSKITEQARHEYTLAYSPRGNDRDSNFHTIEARTTREGLRVKTRRGYYSAPAVSFPPK